MILFGPTNCSPKLCGVALRMVSLCKQGVPGDERMVEKLEDFEKTCAQPYALWRHSHHYDEMPRLGHVSLKAHRHRASTFLNLKVVQNGLAFSCQFGKGPCWCLKIEQSWAESMESTGFPASHFKKQMIPNTSGVVFFIMAFEHLCSVCHFGFCRKPHVRPGRA